MNTCGCRFLPPHTANKGKRGGRGHGSPSTPSARFWVAGQPLGRGQNSQRRAGAALRQIRGLQIRRGGDDPRGPGRSSWTDRGGCC
jgi:hypothetical protein